MSYNQIVEEYEKLSDNELANEFSVVNAYVELVWQDIDNETSERWDVLTQIIQERFIAAHATTYLMMYRNPKDLKA